MSSPSPSAADPTVAYLGPEGSFAHFVARKRYGDAVLQPLDTVTDVFEFLKNVPASRGVVPIENSTGGAIMPTVDGLIDNASTLYIEEELSLDVRLSLIGRKGEKILCIYSHFAPLQHCEKWLRINYPEARHISTSSTSTAAQLAAREPGAAAIGPVENAALYGLDVLYYPIEQHIPNVTHFFVIGHMPRETVDSRKTALVVALKDQPGSLCSFLEPFRDEKVSLKRIQSRPIVGRPSMYMFFIEIEGKQSDPAVQRALAAATNVADTIKGLGSYPADIRFQS